MLRTIRRALAAGLTLSLVAVAAHAAVQERSEIPAKYRWDLTALYPSVQAWQSAKEDLARRIPGMEKYRGTLGTSAADLHRGLAAMMDLSRDLGRLYTYASQLSDEDTRIARHREMQQEMDQIAVQFSTATSWVRPEVIAIGADKVRGFVAAEPKLEDYKPYLEDLVRYEPHTLSPAEEKLVAEAGRMAGAGGTIRGVFDNAEMQWPTITLSTGEQVRLDNAAYTRHRQSPVRADRDAVFRAFWGAHRDFQGTYGAALNEQVQAHVFYRNAHKFESCLEAALFPANVPTSVYRQLIADVNENLPTLHRYLKLRQRMMGVDQLRYEDLYAPIVQEVEQNYTPEQATETVVTALAALGKPYVDVLGRGLVSGWVDWFPSPGKRSGAYSTGAYGVHPYQLQNFTGLWDEVSTLAHESGHSMHTYLAYEKQPYVTADYATFVAEVASTLNENLLLYQVLGRTKDKATRLFLLGSHLETLRGTLFRQTLFAEFELAIHERAERGEVLSGENLTALYLDLVRRYYGHDQGVCTVDDLYGTEWSYIHHFFYNFYVYQYATSIVASTSLASDIRAEYAAKQGTARRDAYLNMLASGSSKEPIPLLRDAGVDMTTSGPFRAAMAEMNSVMDEMEKLLASK